MSLIQKNVTFVYCHNTRIACVWLLWILCGKCFQNV